MRTKAFLFEKISVMWWHDRKNGRFTGCGQTKEECMIREELRGGEKL
jgi:hypothetical protein